jgi:hypothetical protein
MDIGDVEAFVVDVAAGLGARASRTRILPRPSRLRESQG